jgi:DNA-binding transcriptional LysR family regulator
MNVAQQCMAGADELRDAALAAAGGEGGLLRVGFVGSATYSLMPKLLPASGRAIRRSSSCCANRVPLSACG